MGAALLTDPEKVYNVSTGVLVAYSTMWLCGQFVCILPKYCAQVHVHVRVLPSIIHTVVVTFNHKYPCIAPNEFFTGHVQIVVNLVFFQMA